MENKQTVQYEENQAGFFECSCRDRDHTIVARHDVFARIDGESRTVLDNEISFNFVVRHHYCSDNNYRLFKDILWRIKEAIKLIFVGELRVETDWLPRYNADDFDGVNADDVDGSDELKRFAIWILETIDKVRVNNESLKEI